MSPCVTCVATSLAWRWGRSHSVKFKWLRPPFTSLWRSQDTGATWEYQGHTVRLLWQSKQARRNKSRDSGAFHAGSRVAGGFVWSWPKGTNWISTTASKIHLRILKAMDSG